MNSQDNLAMNSQGNLALSVENFGPIVKGEIDLRPLTVFVGPSNTGKSYLAMLIYALQRFFRNAPNGPVVPSWYRTSPRYFYGPPSYKSFRELIGSDEDAEKLHRICGKLIQQIMAQGSEEAIHIDFPEEISRIVRLWLMQMEEYADSLSSEIARAFGITHANDLIRNRGDHTVRIVLKRGISSKLGEPQASEYVFELKDSGLHIRPSIPDSISLYLAGRGRTSDLNYQSRSPFIRSLNLRYFHSLSEGSRDLIYPLSRFLVGLTETIMYQSISPLDRVWHYLPADRTGIMHAHSLVVKSLISQAPLAGLRPDTQMPQLSGVLADFLEQLIGTGYSRMRPRYRRSRTRFKGLAERIEKEILRGRISTETSEVEYPEFYYTPSGWKHDALKLMNSSSMVSELAPVVLFLRHVVQPGDVLIIEEPESHLHPAIQVELTRHLAAAVKAGIRVLITTHSEWVLDELAALVLLSELPECRRDHIKGADSALKPAEIGAWLFEPSKPTKGSLTRGSVIKKIAFDEGYAGFRSGFDDVAIEAHNNYARISDRLEGYRTL